MKLAMIFEPPTSDGSKRCWTVLEDRYGTRGAYDVLDRAARGRDLILDQTDWTHADHETYGNDPDFIVRLADAAALYLGPF